MKLEPITHNEVRKKNTSTVYECIYMEFRKMIMTTQCAMQQKKKIYIYIYIYIYIAHTFGLCGRRQEWDDLRE